MPLFKKASLSTAGATFCRSHSSRIVPLLVFTPRNRIELWFDTRKAYRAPFLYRTLPGHMRGLVVLAVFAEFHQSISRRRRNSALCFTMFAINAGVCFRHVFATISISDGRQRRFCARLVRREMPITAH